MRILSYPKIFFEVNLAVFRLKKWSFVVYFFIEGQWI